MDYEIEYDTGINWSLLILILIFGLAFFNAYSSITAKPVEIAPIKNESKAIQIEYVTILITPTPDGKLYYAGEYEEGVRKIQNPFTFIDYNASGYKTMKVSAFVYDYKTFNVLHWFNPSDQLYYPSFPKENMKYLVVYYAIYLDDVLADDTRFPLPNSDKFVVASNVEPDKFYYPVEFEKQLRIKELEFSKDFNNIDQAQYFGQRRLYSRVEKYTSTAGEYSDVHNIVRGGINNAESGYVIYEIPNNMPDDQLIAGMNLYAFGNTWWRLKP